MLCGTTVHGIECATRAYTETLEEGAERVEPGVEQRLQALLAGRVAPLLLRCLQLWKAGARRPVRGPRVAPRCIASSRSCAPAPAASSGAGDHRRALCPGHAVRMVAPKPRRAHARSPARAGAALRRAPSSMGPALLRAAPRPEKCVPDGTACLSGCLLGNLLSVPEVCMRVPGKERIRAMRHLYALLQWTSQRLAELVRARTERAACRGRAARSLRSPAARLRRARGPKPAMR